MHRPKRLITALATVAVMTTLSAAPAAGQAPAAPDWVEPGMGQPTEPSCQGYDRSGRAQKEPGLQAEVATRFATGTEYGVGDNVTAHHTEHGSCATEDGG